MAGMLAPDALCRNESLVGVGRRHPDVDDHGVRSQRLDQGEQAAGVRRLPHDLVPGLFEQVRDSLAGQHGVVGDQLSARQHRP